MLFCLALHATDPDHSELARALDGLEYWGAYQPDRRIDFNGFFWRGPTPVLIDPIQETQVYFPAGSLPATLIVDSEGTIVHREYGVSESLSTIRAALDDLLAERGL